MLKEENGIKENKATIRENSMSNNLDMSFFKIKEIVFEDEKPSRENIENIISSMRKINLNILYILIGRKNKVELYLGLVNTDKNDMILSSDYCFNYFKDIFLGNYKGSTVKELKKSEVEKEILSELDNRKYISVLKGVPTLNEEKNNFQNIEYLINSMLGNEFQIVINMKPCFEIEVENYEKFIMKEYEQLYKENNIRIQFQIQKGKSESTDNTETYNESKNNSEVQEKRSGTDEREEEGSRKSKISSESWSKTENKSKIEDKRTSKNYSRTENESEIETYEKIDKKYQELLNIYEEQIFPKISIAKNKGLFKVQVLVSSSNLIVQEKMEGIFLSLLQSNKKNISPTYFEKINKKINIFEFIKEKEIDDNRLEKYYTLSKVIEEKNILTASYMNVEEISLLIGLPQKDVMGISVREGVDYGINIPDIKSENKIKLGKIIHRGTISKNIVVLDKNELNKHIFIAGTTGAGKTTTCHKLLNECELPFLVIEPAKTEYREMILYDSEIEIYTLGREENIPFRINPFEFLETENITSHVDMIKASFEAAFDMDAAIPQLIEASIYRCYENYGWDISDNSNIYLEDRSLAWKSGGIYFPTLTDLLKVVEDVVKEKKMGERLEGEYIGSIKARLEGLIVGAKGQMLNTRCSFDFEELLRKKIILELEEIKSGQDKALIMGVILTRLCETIKKIHQVNPKFKHITLIEEAHRLLAKAYPGEGIKKQAVEIFADMLAEIRKYGESLIIVDQIPEKLAPEVLKNTNTKIIHKIFSRDDKNVVGDTMSMSDKQKEFLSNLSTGEAIIFSQGWQKAVQVKIEKIEEKYLDEYDKERKIEEKLKLLRDNILTEKIEIFYPGLHFLKNLKGIHNKREIIDNYKKFIKIIKIREKKILTLKEIVKLYSEEELKKFLILSIIKNNAKIILEGKSLEEEIIVIWNDIQKIINNEYKSLRLTSEQRTKEILNLI